MLPLCADARIAVLPWSPLARGRLTRPWNTETARTKTDPFGSSLYATTEASDRKVVDQVAAIATSRGIPQAQVALAWLLSRGDDVVPIPGSKGRRYLEENATAAAVELTAAELAQLEGEFPPGAAAGAREADMSTVNL